jgi:hypothetical protein
MWDSTDFFIVVSPAFNRSWFCEHVLGTTTEFLYHMCCQHWLQLVHPTDGNEIQHENIDRSYSTFLISQIKSVVEWMVLKEVTEDLTLRILFSSFMLAVLPCLPVGHACPTSPALISFLPYSTHCTELEDPTVTGTMTLRIVGRCVSYTTRVLWAVFV